MILEHADIRIDPLKSSAFEEAILRGVTTVIAHAKGFKGYKVNRSMDSVDTLATSATDVVCGSAGARGCRRSYTSSVSGRAASASVGIPVGHAP